ncbi:Nif3-like dinuclear metal center hexameric protein [Bifidobacterium stellenboschense]|uniref:GTP cyclohydrolase 1 type 2 homolog n=1 Tax=Bifidobacterium stellenboschense TaxID=762211 RepID=A0A087DZR7_9BIFI|nr:Nif3-like dinuclear metal center hexameric protein [Bifidobacterium stellenboschense]KFJ01018.1 PadR family transcriptional regulator [Bifidobacterium stellenboschense]
MTNLNQVVDTLETLYPLKYAESWDAPGLIVGDLTAPVTRIAFACDPTMAVIDEALEWGADLLVTHHPLFFRSVHQVSGLGARGMIVNRLNRAGCALWVGHTNADCAVRGVGQAAADGFGLVDQRALVPVDDPEAAGPVGLGRVGRLPEPVTLREFARRVCDALSIDTALGVQACGDPDTPVETVAVLPGSGDSLFDEVRAAGVDVYVTSDLRHHPATDAIEQARYEASMRAAGVTLGTGDAHVRPCLVNTPHSAIESMWFRYAVDDIADALERRFGERPETNWIRRDTDPWTFSLHRSADAPTDMTTEGE